MMFFPLILVCVLGLTNNTITMTTGFDVFYEMLDADTYRFEVTVSGERWVGLGFNAGSTTMVNSDVVVVDNSGVTDRHITSKSIVGVAVDTSNDLSDTSYTMASGSTVFEFTRAANTEDSEDVNLEESGVNFVWALGASTGATSFDSQHTSRGSKAFVSLSYDSSASASPTTETSAPTGSPTVAETVAGIGESGSLTVASDLLTIQYEALDSTLASYRFTVEYEGEGWVSIGFHTEEHMVGTDAVLFHPSDSLLTDRHITSKSTSGVALDSSQDLLDKQMGQNATHTWFSFTRQTEASDEDDISLSDAVYLVWAVGSSNTFAYHSMRGFSVLNGDPTLHSTESSTTWPTWAYAHGALMFAAWIVLIPSGIFSSVFLRPLGPLWFKIHRTCQTLGVIVSIVGFLFAATNMTGDMFTEPHHNIGLVVVIVSVYQLIHALVRPHVPDNSEKSTQRKLWEIIHRLTALALLVLAVVNIESGLGMINDSNLETAFIAVGCITFLAWVLLVGNLQSNKYGTAG